MAPSTFIQRPLRPSRLLPHQRQDDRLARPLHHIHNLLVGQAVETDAVQLWRRTAGRSKTDGAVQVEARVRRAESYGYQAILDEDVSALVRSAAWNHVFDKHAHGV